MVQRREAPFVLGVHVAQRHGPPQRLGGGRLGAQVAAGRPAARRAFVAVGDDFRQRRQRTSPGLRPMARPIGGSLSFHSSKHL